MKTDWNLELLYKNISDPQIEIDIQESKHKVNTFIKKWKDTNEYLTNPNILLTALKVWYMYKTLLLHISK